MKTTTSNLTGLDIVGNANRSSDQEIFTATIKKWRRRLSYCSVFAAVPALLAANLPQAHNAEAKEPEAKVAGPGARLVNRNNNSISNLALLKRQSNFVLPHQKGNFAVLAALTGNDDCPGRTILGGNYTATAPYIDSGDTTGANNTVGSLSSAYYYYYNYDASGPDHVYSFTLTDRGPNAQIEVSTTSGTYKPLIYVLVGGAAGPCPAGTGNLAGNWQVINDSRWHAGSNSVTLGVQHLPLNVPLHLFVDSAFNDAAGSGDYKIRMQDVTIAPAAACSRSNPIDCVDNFVRQQYRDFFDREPDSVGFQNWVNTLANCPNDGFGEPPTSNCDRVHISGSFVQSHEFQGRGYWILRYGYVGLNRAIGSVRSSATYAEFTPALAQIGGSNSPAQEEAAKVAYANAFVQRSDFLALFPTSMTASQYVDALESNAQVTVPNKQALVNALNVGAMTRADVLRNVVESQVVFDKYIIPAFVTMEYFGYLDRDPDTIGYQNWVNTLIAEPNNYRHMIFGFIYSTEYRQRFGPA